MVQLPTMQNISRSVRYTEASIVTLYGLEDSGFELWWGQRFSRFNTHQHWLCHPSNRLYMGAMALSGGLSGRGVVWPPTVICACMACYKETFSFMWCTRVLYNMPDRPLKGSRTIRDVQLKRQSERSRDQERSTGNGRLEKRNSTIKYR